MTLRTTIHLSLIFSVLLLPIQVLGQNVEYTVLESDTFQDGNSIYAKFNNPTGIAIDKKGNVFVADRDNHCIRKISTNQEVTTFAGSRKPGFLDGSGTTAMFNHPVGLAFDNKGDLYVADRDNHSIRKISPTGIVTTYAGNGKAGDLDSTCKEANFCRPNGLAIDLAGNVFVADTKNNKIRKITKIGEVVTLAGSSMFRGEYKNGLGGKARFYEPTSITILKNGDMYVCDSKNNRIRKVNQAGEVTNFVGSGIPRNRTGNGESASFGLPIGICKDKSGSLFVTARCSIIKVEPNKDADIFAGFDLDFRDGIGQQAAFYEPTGIAIDSLGNLFVADTGNNIIRKITVNGVVSTYAGKGKPF
jgi:sugar lactone lactonase YvrE